MHAHASRRIHRSFTSRAKPVVLTVFLSITACLAVAWLFGLPLERLQLSSSSEPVYTRDISSSVTVEGTWAPYLHDRWLQTGFTLHNRANCPAEVCYQLCPAAAATNATAAALLSGSGGVTQRGELLIYRQGFDSNNFAALSGFTCSAKDIQVLSAKQCGPANYPLLGYVLTVRDRLSHWIGVKRALPD